MPKKIAEGIFALHDRNACVYALVDGRRALLVDAGYEETPAGVLFPFFADQGIAEVDRIILTHGHGDHYEGCGPLKLRYGTRIAAHPLDAPLITVKGDAVLFEGLERRYPGYFSTPKDRIPTPPADDLLHDGEIITFGRFVLRIVHAPGHSDGSLCVWYETRRVLFTGDTVAGDSVHFYGQPAVYAASRRKLATLPFETLLLAHPYPPAGVYVHNGRDAHAFLAATSEALEKARQTARGLAAAGRSPVHPKELTAALPGVTTISAIRLLEEAGAAVADGARAVEGG